MYSRTSPQKNQKSFPIVLRWGAAVHRLLQTSSIFSCPWEVSQSACFSSKIRCEVIFWYRKPRACQKFGVGKCLAPGQRKICKCPTPGTDKGGECPAVACSVGDALNSLYKNTVLRNRVCSITACVFRSYKALYNEILVLGTHTVVLKTFRKSQKLIRSKKKTICPNRKT